MAPFAVEESSGVNTLLTPTAGLVLLNAQNRMVYHNPEAANILVFPRPDGRTNGAVEAHSLKTAQTHHSNHITSRIKGDQK